MSTLVEKIKDIEKEISRTQINKATMSHLCTLRAKLAKYRTELLTPDKKGGGGEGFDVEKVGDARVAGPRPFASSTINQIGPRQWIRLILGRCQLLTRYLDAQSIQE